MADYTEYTVWGVGVSAFLVLSTIIFLSQKSPKSQKKAKSKAKVQPKKLTLVEQFELTLKKVHERVSQELEPGVNAYYEQFESLKADDKVYKFNYYQEELLKELIKLDGIELGDLEGEKKAEFKARRKEGIKAVQIITRGLDAFKKEHAADF